MSRGDAVVIATVALYLAFALLCLVVDIPREGGSLADRTALVLYSVLALLTIAEFARLSRLSFGDPEWAGWTLLGLGVAARYIYGVVWNLVPSVGDPSGPGQWQFWFGISYLVFGLPALLLFPRTRWQGRNAERARLDSLTVLLGSVLVVWFLAIGPLVRSATAATAPLAEIVRALGDALAVTLAARIHLRAARVSTRLATTWILLALFLRLAPSVTIWRVPEQAEFLVFGAIDATWFLVWAMFWAGARTARSRREAHPAADERPPAGYVSGLVPHAFLAAAVGALLLEVFVGDGRDVGLFAVSSALLALLLVSRQGIELDERDALAQRLEREGARYEALLRHAYDAVVMFDARGVLRYASPATVRTVGKVIESGDEEALWNVVHPDDRALLRSALAARPESAEPEVVAIRLRVRDAAAQWRTFEGHLHDHRADPHVGAIVLNGVDRTREAKLAEGLAAAQPLEALGVLAGGLAHDLNNILTVVASHAELLDADRAVDARGREDVRAIRAASDRARTLTRGLLSLSRRKQGPSAALDIPSTVREVLGGLPGTQVEFPPETPLAVLAEPAALRQVIEGLVDAARDPAGAGPATEPTDALFHVTVGARAVADAEATALGIEPRLYVGISAGARFLASAPVQREEAVRIEAGKEWDLAPLDLALLIALAAARELGGTVVRERQGERTRYSALLPAVQQ